MKLGPICPVARRVDAINTAGVFLSKYERTNYSYVAWRCRYSPATESVVGINGHVISGRLDASRALCQLDCCTTTRSTATYIRNNRQFLQYAVGKISKSNLFVTQNHTITIKDGTSGHAMVVHSRPKTPKNTSFWGHPAPRGRTAPVFYGTQLDPDM